jgi:site-specific recombinase XerD
MSDPSSEFINNHYDYEPTSKDKDVGGNSQEWKTQLEKERQTPLEKHIPTAGEIMEVLPEYEINQFKRTDFPITLKPGESSFRDVALHGKLRQRLSNTTIEKHLRYARFMETHEVPVNFRNPNFRNFINHMDFREQTGAGYSALRHEWDAMKMFLRSYGIPLWDYKPPKKKTPKPRNLPLPDTVYSMMHFKYSEDAYENALYQYLFTLGFTIGFRVPTEICELKLEDVFIDENQTGFLIITETKKGRNTRTVTPRKQILSSPTHKSLKNYIDHWRPKAENQFSGDALFLWKSGKPVTVRTLGHKLSENGKKVWKYFQPYDMRRWCAIARLIETKVENGKFDEFEVCDWLGHDDVKTTMAYIKDAKQYYKRAPYNWLKRILKNHHKNNKMLVGENTLKNRDIAVLPPFRVETTGVTRYGGTGTCTTLSKGFHLRYSLKRVSWQFSSPSLIFSFYFSLFEQVHFLFLGIPKSHLVNGGIFK